jgi:hypothetical protein
MSLKETYLVCIQKHGDGDVKKNNNDKISKNLVMTMK